MKMSLWGQEGVSHPESHMETLTMSRNEREGMMIMAGVKSNELTQVQAAELMGLGYRQAKRVWRRYQDEGEAGLVHRLRGQPGGRRKPDARAKVRRKVPQGTDRSIMGRQRGTLRVPDAPPWLKERGGIEGPPSPCPRTLTPALSHPMGEGEFSDVLVPSHDAEREGRLGNKVASLPNP